MTNYVHDVCARGLNLPFVFKLGSAQCFQN